MAGGSTPGAARSPDTVRLERCQARDGERRFWKCLHRLRGALEARRVLPGAGAFEAACAARLAQEAEARLQRFGRDCSDGGELPLSELLRCEAMLALGTALGNLCLDVLHNAGVAPAEAAARLKASDDCWRQLSAPHMRALYQQSPALLWRDVAWSPLVGVDAVGGGGGGDGGGGGGGDGGSSGDVRSSGGDSGSGGCGGGGGVYDTVGAKLAALEASIDTLQLLLLSDAVLTNQRQLEQH